MTGSAPPRENQLLFQHFEQRVYSIVQRGELHSFAAMGFVLNGVDQAGTPRVGNPVTRAVPSSTIPDFSFRRGDLPIRMPAGD